MERLVVGHLTKDLYKNCETCGQALYTIRPMGGYMVQSTHQNRMKQESVDWKVRSILCDDALFQMILVMEA